MHGIPYAHSQNFFLCGQNNILTKLPPPFFFFFPPMKKKIFFSKDVVYLERNVHYATLSYSPSAHVNGSVWQVRNFGCELEDYNRTDSQETVIGIVSRGTCT